MKKLSLLLPLFYIISLTIFAQIPESYYNAAVGKKQAELKTTLHLIIKNANPPSYGSGASSTWGAFTKTDVRPEDGTVWDMYSNNHVAFNGTSAATGMNIEHSVANSWWGGTKNQTYNDLFNLNPSNITANSNKGSYPIAVVDGNTTYSNGVIKVGRSSSRPGGEIDAWEPADEYKGDFARSYMYMVTCYEDFSAKWTGNSINQLDNNTYPVFEQWTVDLFLKWCAQDPVSQKEIDRNNEIYKIQNNRNPYIDYPELAEYIWGNKMGTNWTLNPTTDPILYSPSTGSSVDFGTVNYQQSSSKTVFVQGSNLTGNLNISLSGANAAYFTLSMNTITPAEAQTGSNVNITYNPSEVGTHTATLTISGGGITTVTVSLTGNSVTCQNVSLSAPFSTTISPFTQYSVSGDQIWTWKSATYGVAMSGYVNSVNNPNEDWLISPVLDLSNVENVVLSFSHTINKGVVANMQTENTVYVSNNYFGGNPNTAAWTKLTIPTFPTGADWVFVNSGDVQIPAINCLSSTCIAFKYICTSSSSATWEIKNLSIAGVCKSTGVESVNKNITHKITVENRNISIFNLEIEDVQVYDIYGKKVFTQKCVTGKVTVNTVPQGIYIIRAGNEVQKLIVK